MACFTIAGTLFGNILSTLTNVSKTLYKQYLCSHICRNSSPKHWRCLLLCEEVKSFLELCAGLLHSDDVEVTPVTGNSL